MNFVICIPCFSSIASINFSPRHSPHPQCNECFSLSLFFSCVFAHLCANGPLPTPFLSIISALFSMEWRGSHQSSPPTGHQSRITIHQACKFALLFSTTSTMPLPQLVSFHTFASLPGVGRGVNAFSPILKRLPKFLASPVKRRKVEVNADGSAG